MNKRIFVALCAAVVVLSTNVAFAQQKTAKECQDEWRANKAANQAAKITEKAYVEKCRSGSASAQPAPASAAKPSAPAAAAPAAAPAAPKAAAKPAPAAPVASTAPTGANQFASDSQAKARCPSDTVVWVNLPTKVYHFAGKKDYGNTKSGAYMCEKDAMASGMRAAKNEKHP
jgi:hypothetical protein